MGRRVLTIISIILFVITIAGTLFIGFRYNLFLHPNKTYIFLMVIMLLVQLSVIFIARFKK